MRLKLDVVRSGGDAIASDAPGDPRDIRSAAVYQTDRNLLAG
jgi:hypothetical protein